MGRMRRPFAKAGPGGSIVMPGRGDVACNADQGAGTQSQERKTASDRLSTLKADIAGRELDILQWLGVAWPPTRRQSHIHCPFPGHDDKNPSWRWDARKCAWFCSKCGGGDVFHAVERMKGVSFAEALDLIETDFLGRSSDRTKRDDISQRDVSGAVASGGDQRSVEASLSVEDAARRRKRALELWSEAKPISGTLAETYFERHRGILLDWTRLANSVRFHPTLWCSEREGAFPAILFKVSEAFDGELMTIHRLYLGEDAGKATIAHPKKAYGDFAGGAIWLGEPSDGGELVKAEGPENALVCFMAGLPFVASALSGANLKNVAAPAMIKRVIIAGDRGRGGGKGKAGEDYAEDAASADRKRSGVAVIAYPPGAAKAQRQMAGLERPSLN